MGLISAYKACLQALKSMLSSPLVDTKSELLGNPSPGVKALPSHMIQCGCGPRGKFSFLVALWKSVNEHTCRRAYYYVCPYPHTRQYHYQFCNMLLPFVACAYGTYTAQKALFCPSWLLVSWDNAYVILCDNSCFVLFFMHSMARTVPGVP